MKTKHHCVENGGCKAADCDGGKSEMKTRELITKSAEADKEFTRWQLDMINIVVNGIELREETVREYNRARTVHNRLIRLVVGDMCK